MPLRAPRGESPVSMDRIGAGAEGTGGRTSPRQQPAAVAGGEGEQRVTGLKEDDASDQGPSATRLTSSSPKVWNSLPTTRNSSSSSTT